MSRIATAIGAARATADVTHAGVRGTIRDILIRELFRPLLPSDVGVGTGQIATAAGELSPQQDVIIYNRRILPPVLFEESVGIFPVESVLAIVEVKTTLTAGELRSAYDSAMTIQNYTYLSGDRIEDGGKPTPHMVKNAVSTIFALNSDLAAGGKTELERLAEIDASNDPPVRAICVSGRGYWFYTDEWRFLAANEEHQETMSFVVGLFDMLLLR